MVEVVGERCFVWEVERFRSFHGQANPEIAEEGHYL
jgi:hypothetical protein